MYIFLNPFSFFWPLARMVASWQEKSDYGICFSDLIFFSAIFLLPPLHRHTPSQIAIPNRQFRKRRLVIREKNHLVNPR